jgi:ABC transporter substrate binding protein (PQQ-dependent alcohol dehydrogenase system)
MRSQRVLLWATMTMLALCSAAAARAQTTSPAGASAPSATFLYISRADEPESRGALSEPVVADFGLQGARFGIKELNANGQFLGVQFDIRKLVVPADADLAADVRPTLRTRPALIVADLKAKDLLALADMQEAQGGVIVDARTSDDELRQDECRNNVFHVLPSWDMRAAALSHFMADKGWRHWLLLTGATDDDVHYSTALRRAGRAGGAKVVQEARLPAVGPDSSLTQQQVDERIEAVTRSRSTYDVIFVTDLDDAIGERVMFGAALPRVLAGTQGLRAVAWDPQFRDFAARGFEYRFLQFASRTMSERDYGNWLAVSVLGEAVMRGHATNPTEVRSYLRSDRFSVAAFKGEPLSFRDGGQQLRQPVLLFAPRILVALSPPGVPPGAGARPSTATGASRPRSECQGPASPQQQEAVK